MTAQTQNSQSQQTGNSGQLTEAKPSDKELNFRALENKLAQERAARLEMERQIQHMQEERNKPVQHEEEEDDEPYIDKKRLNKTLNKYGQQAKQETQQEIQKAVSTALQEERKQNWLKNNPDFHSVLQHAEKFAERDPELAESILTIPDPFERQKAAYKNIKALGIDRPEEKQQSIQDKVDANKRSPYYQPSGVGTAPYASAGDFSASGQKNAYDKMQELKKRLRI